MNIFFLFHVRRFMCVPSHPLTRSVGLMDWYRNQDNSHTNALTEEYPLQWYSHHTIWNIQTCTVHENQDLLLWVTTREDMLLSLFYESEKFSFTYQQTENDMRIDSQIRGRRQPSKTAYKNTICICIATESTFCLWRIMFFFFFYIKIFLLIHY